MATRHLDPNISGLSFDKDGHPGCLWGVLHVLRSYQWHNVKKMIPNKKHGSRRQTANMRYSRIISDVPDISEAQGSGDAEADGINITDMSEKRLASNRSSKRNKSSNRSFRTHYQRTESIHHLEPSDDRLPDEIREVPGAPVSCCNGYDLCNTTTSVENLSHNQLDELGRQLLDNALLQKKLERAKEAFLRQKKRAAKEPSKDVAVHQTKEVLDVFEMFNVNNELLQKTLMNSFKALQTSNEKRGLTKSRSFPADESSSRNSGKPSKLKYRQKEAAFFDDNAVSFRRREQGSPDMDLTSTSSSPGPRVELKKRRFKDIKKKIKNAIKESKKERHRISMDAIFHKMPYGSRFSKDLKRGKHGKFKEPVMDNVEKENANGSDVSNNSSSSIRDGGINNMRRSQSLNESLDRYSQLFELSYGRDPKQNPTEGSKFANDSGNLSSGSAPRTFRRILSLPNLESNQYGDTIYAPSPSRFCVESDTSIGSLFSPEQSTTLVASAEYDGQETDQGIILADKAEAHSLYITDISSVPTKISSSKGSELNPGQIQVDELHSHSQSSMDSLGEAIINPSLEKVKLPRRYSTSDIQQVQVDKKDEADFNYVKDVLKLSGFSENEYLGTWFSPDQPVDPSLYEEVEINSPLKSDFSGDDVSSGYDHHLLFDIINEVLLEIYDKSFTYWPCPLSCNCHIRPLAIGYHVLEEVWAIISWYLNSQPEFEPLDYLVVRDLSKNDGWMNLQFDSECVGLELEEMILDDLLDEVIED